MRGIPAVALILVVTGPVKAQDSRSPHDRWLGPDKAVHLLSAYWAAGAGYAAGIELDWDSEDRRTVAVATGVTTSLSKELWDAGFQRERFSWKDLVADAAGILIFVAVASAAE